MSGSGDRTAVEWPAAVAPDRDACRWEWERNPQGIALLPAGRRWDVLILPGALGCPTLDVLTRLVDRPGPVLADFGESRMGFLCRRARRAGGSVRASARPARASGSSCPVRAARQAACAG